jgi:hypothetical protein
MLSRRELVQRILNLGDPDSEMSMRKASHHLIVMATAGLLADRKSVV